MKKIAAMLLIASLGFSVAACGGTKTASAPEPAKTEETKEEAKEEAKEESTGEAETGVGKYAVVNNTGENVTGLYLYEAGSSDKGENYAGSGMADEAKTDLTFEGAADATLILEFETEGGYKAAFETLHIEEVTISLLASDALTGATPIMFVKGE